MKTKTSILITGCSSGIGLAVANDLSNKNYQVFASCRKPEDIERLKQQYPSIQWVLLDVTDSHSIDTALEFVLNKTNGRLDALFNNASIAIPGAVEDLTKKAMLEQFDTSVFGLLELTNKVLPIMREQGSGKIIVNSSILGFISLRYRGAYIAAKHALEGLFDTLRLELMDTPIHVCIIQPGPIQSKFRDNAMQSFSKHIDVNKSYHGANYEKMQEKFTSNNRREAFALPATAVSKTILKILKSKNPRARYSITIPTYVSRVLARILPRKALDSLLYNATKHETD